MECSVWCDRTFDRSICLIKCTSAASPSADFMNINWFNISKYCFHSRWFVRTGYDSANPLGFRRLQVKMYLLFLITTSLSPAQILYPSRVLAHSRAQECSRSLDYRFSGSARPPWQRLIFCWDILISLDSHFLRSVLQFIGGPGPQSCDGP